MRTINLVIVFGLVLLIHCWGLYTGIEWMERMTKPLLLVILIGYFLSGTKQVSSGLKKWVVAALLFSWIGDNLLMFVYADESFFVCGLAAFLIAHIFYGFFFHTIRVYEKIREKLFLFLLVFAYYTILMSVLSPSLGSLKVPVRIYGVVICFVLMLAMHMLYLANKKAGVRMFTGALLFVISDSVLALDKFHRPFMEAGIIIMITYGLAQLLIVQGAIRYITADNGQQKLP
jgi:uncharacterized membrane protein YhhN